MSPLEITIIAGLSSIMGGIIVSVTTYFLTEMSKTKDRQIAERHKQIDRELTERARELDFYKLIYPEKMKAAVDLNNRASKSFMDIREFFLGAQDPKRGELLARRLGDILWRAKMYEFLLGENIVQLASDYRMVCMRAFLRTPEFRDLPAFVADDVWAHEHSYMELAVALRRAVHLDALDHLPVPGAIEQIVGRERRERVS